MPRAPTPLTSLARAQEPGIETCGRIARFWGFTHTMGRTFGLLYLSPRPLAQAEIQARLGISAGSASMTLADLRRWGVVLRAVAHGKRPERYAAETDFWKMITGVLDRRERRVIKAAVKLTARGGALARRARSRTAGRTRADARFVDLRLRRLHDICRLGETILDMVLGSLRLDLARVRHLMGS